MSDEDGFISVFDPQGNGTDDLVYSTLVGAGGRDNSGDVLVDEGGKIYITGSTETATFPVTSGAYDTTYNDYSRGSDVFLTILEPKGDGVADLVYSTYLGGDEEDAGHALALSETGKVYISGIASRQFPTAGNSYDTSPNGGCDGFLAIINPLGKGADDLEYSTVIGTSSYDYFYGMALHTNGRVYLTGYTENADYPTTANAYEKSYHGGNDVVFSVINPAGGGPADLEYSTYIGGSGNDRSRGVAVDSLGRAFIAGSTSSVDYPTSANAYDTTPNGEDDITFTVIDPSKNGVDSFVYSSYLGGLKRDVASDIRVDAEGRGYICGLTSSSDYPKTAHAYDASANGYNDASVAVLNPVGGGSGDLIYSTIIGGSSYDEAKGISLDANGKIYLTGSTSSSNFPVTPDAVYSSYRGGQDSYLVVIDPQSNGKVDLAYATYLGGSGSDSGTNVFARTDKVCVLGYSDSSNFPTTAGAYDTSLDGQDVTLSIIAPRYTLTVQKTGNGTVSSVPEGIDCGGDCLETVAPGYAFTLTATPDDYYRFAGWFGGGLSGTEPATVTLNTRKLVEARFLPIPPAVITNAATRIDSTAATLKGSVNANNKQAAIRFEYGETTGYGTTVSADPSTVNGTTDTSVSADIAGLIPLTCYHYRIIATNDGGTAYGADMAVTTGPEASTVTTQAPTHVGTTTATGHGNIIRLGAPAPTQRGVCWSTSANPTTAGSRTMEGPTGATGAFTSHITGLTSGTTYYVRAYAINRAGTTYGSQVSFKTLKTGQNIAFGAFTGKTYGDPAFKLSATASSGLPVSYLSSDLDVATISGSTLTIVGSGTTTVTALQPGNGQFFAAENIHRTLIVTGTGVLEQAMATLANTPTRRTSVRTYNVTVGGIGVLYYKYKVDDGAWIEKTSITEPLEFFVEAEGVHTLRVVGEDSIGSWQDAADPTICKWVVDTMPPVAEIKNAPKGTTGNVSTAITVGGADVQFFKYKFEETEWSKPLPVKNHIMASVTEKMPKLYVAGMDTAGNWQPEESASTVEWTIDLSVPTAVLSGLPTAVTKTTTSTVRVGGENVTAFKYNIIGPAAEYDGTWSEERSINNPIEFAVAEDGSDDGEYTLYVNAMNAANTWQDGEEGETDGSATRYTWTLDTTAPKALDTLAAPRVNVSSTTIGLTWPVVENGLGMYHIWCSKSAFTGENLDDAQKLFCNIVPGHKDETEIFNIAGLTSDTTYYFAVKSEDSVGNLSDVSNVISLATSDTRPVITSLELTAGGVSGDNGIARELTVTGEHFISNTGDNIVRFVTRTNVFDVPSKAGTQTQIHVDVPIGSPVGEYNIRVINRNGVSLPSGKTYAVTESSRPQPEVTNVSPVIGRNDVDTSITITGDNFAEELTEVTLGAVDGTILHPLTDVVWLSSNKVTATIPSGIRDGQYSIQVQNPNGDYNRISSVEFEVSTPVNFRDTSGAVSTSKVVLMPADGVIPFATDLTTNDRTEIDIVSDNSMKIVVSIDPATQITLDDGTPYTETLAPPRQLPVKQELAKKLVSGRISDISSAVAFTVGNSEQSLKFGADQTVFVKLEFVKPMAGPLPSIYYLAADGSLTLAGVDGTINGIDISQGGTFLSARPGVPEEGLVTYTAGLLLDHMSTYVAGTKMENSVPGDEGDYGPCFITSSHSGDPGLFIILSLFGALGIAGGALLKRFTPVIIVVAAMLIMVHPQAVVAGEIPAGKEGTALKMVSDSPWTVKVGLGFSFIGEEYKASAGGTTYDLDVDNAISPLIRVDYAFSTHFSLELKAALNLYSGSMDELGAEGASSVRGYTLGFGPVWYLAKRHSSFAGAWRPFVHAGMEYRDLKDNLNYAVNDFHSALGAEFGVGVQSQNMEFRIGYNHSIFDESGSIANLSDSATSNDLDLSGIVIEVAWCVPMN